MSLDIDSLSPDELSELAAKAKAMAEEKKQASIDEAIASITELAKSAGLTVRISTGETKRGTMPVTHRNPLNEKEVWRGMGPKPGWLKYRLAAGAKLEDFAV